MRHPASPMSSLRSPSSVTLPSWTDERSDGAASGRRATRVKETSYFIYSIITGFSPAFVGFPLLVVPAPLLVRLTKSASVARRGGNMLSGIE